MERKAQATRKKGHKDAHLNFNNPTSSIQIKMQQSIDKGNTLPASPRLRKNGTLPLDEEALAVRPEPQGIKSD
jgi:hypothetical protein